MKKEVVSQLNTLAKFDFKKAQAMLEGINLVLSTEYYWLNKRVVFDDPKGHSHDAWACAE